MLLVFIGDKFCYAESMKKNHAGLTFSDRVLKIALMIPSGKLTTYGRIARAAGGGAMSSQSITGILGKAEMSGVKGIPFHRIVYANGRVWMNSEYRARRLALYKKEGIRLDGKDRIIDFEDHLM